MAYLEDQAMKRAAMRRRMLNGVAGDTAPPPSGALPGFGQDTMALLQNLGVNLGMPAGPRGLPPGVGPQGGELSLAPKGVAVSQPSELKVSPHAEGRRQSGGEASYQGGGSDLGSGLGSILQNAKDSAIKAAREKQAGQPGQTGPLAPPGTGKSQGVSIHDMARRGKGVGGSNVQSWMDFAQKSRDQGGLGLAKHQAEGLVANLIHESGENINPLAHNTKGENSFGAAQWNHERHRALINFAQTNKMDYRTTEAQQAFMRHEFDTTENAAYRHLQGTRTAREAATSYNRNYERSRDNTGSREATAERLSQRAPTTAAAPPAGVKSSPVRQADIPQPPENMSPKTSGDPTKFAPGTPPQPPGIKATPPAVPPAPAAPQAAAPVAPAQRPQAAATAPVAPNKPTGAAARPPVNPAHAYLDMNAGAFAESMQKGASSQLPGDARGMTVRELLNSGYGSFAKGEIQKAITSKGVTPQQYNDAVKEGRPGKRTEALPGTSEGLLQQAAAVDQPAPAAEPGAQYAAATPTTATDAAPGPAYPPAETNREVSAERNVVGEGPYRTLAEQRAEFGRQMAENPALADRFASIVLAETGHDPTGRAGEAETILNRAVASGQTSLDKALDPNYYKYLNPADKGHGYYQGRLDELRRDPSLRPKIDADIKRAIEGSNVTDLATDNASGTKAKEALKTQTPTYTSPGGEQFFRKDINTPEGNAEHGARRVQQNRDWFDRTRGGMGQERLPLSPIQSDAMPPPGPQASAGGPEFSSRGRAQPPSTQLPPALQAAITNVFSGEQGGPATAAPPPPADPMSMPVLPSQVAPAAPGAPGGPPPPGGLAPPGLAPQMMLDASQGSPIAMMGLSPIQPVQNVQMSTPLVDSMATQQPFASQGLSPIPFAEMAGWGWGGSPMSGGLFDGGGGGGFSGLDMGGMGGGFTFSGG